MSRIPLALCFVICCANTVAGDPCDAILAGMFDRIEYQSEARFRSDLRKITDWSLEKMKEEEKSASGGLKALIKTFTVGVDAEYNRKILQSLKVHFRHELEYAWESAEYSKLKSVLANKYTPDLAKAWLACKLSGNAARASAPYCNPDSGEFLVTVEYFPSDKDDPKEIVIANVIPAHATPVGTSVVTSGTRLREFSGLSQLYRRTDCRKDSVVRFDIEGRGAVQAHCEGISCPPGSAPYSYGLTWPLSYFGPAQWSRLAGGDDEMDIDPGDRVGVEVITKVWYDSKRVYLNLKFSAVEAGGNGTKLGGEKNNLPIYDAPTGESIIGVDCKSGCDKLLNHTYVGHKSTRHVVFGVPGAPGTYWKSLAHCLDSATKNDLSAFGIQGELYVDVRLKPDDKPCPPCP